MTDADWAYDLAPDPICCAPRRALSYKLVLLRDRLSIGEDERYCEIGDLIPGYTTFNGPGLSTHTRRLWFVVRNFDEAAKLHGKHDVYTDVILEDGSMHFFGLGVKYCSTMPISMLLRPEFGAARSISDWPGRCPGCGGAAYLGLNDIMCKSSCQKQYAAR